MGEEGDGVIDLSRSSGLSRICSRHSSSRLISSATLSITSHEGKCELPLSRRESFPSESTKILIAFSTPSLQQYRGGEYGAFFSRP